MAGMGLEGAYGAAGTFKGLEDWMRGQRTQVVQGQRDEDRLREQRLQDEALATASADRERTIARQGLVDSQNAELFKQKQTEFQQEQDSLLTPEQMQTVMEQIKASDMPPMAKVGLQITVQQTKRVPKEAWQYMGPPKAPPVRHVFAPNGQLVDPDAPENLGRNFAPPKTPAAGEAHNYSFAPDGSVVDMRDPKNLGKTFAKPAAAPTYTAKQRDALQNASVARSLLMELKPLYVGDEKTKGVRDVIGPVGGRWESFKNTYGLANNPTFQQFEAATARLRNATIQAITGAAVGVKEAERIMGEVPTENDIGPKWEQKWMQAIRNVEYLENAIREQSGTGTQMPDAVNDALPGNQGVVLTPRSAGGGGVRIRYDAAGNRVP